MKTIILFALLFVLNCLSCFTQKRGITVLDNTTDRPVSYTAVTVFSGDNIKGCYTDSCGKILIDMDTKMDSIFFSCVGYHPSIFYKLIDIGDTVKLAEKNYGIKEVCITPNRIKRTVKIGNVSKRSVAGFSAFSGIECATFIANTFDREVPIKNVFIKIKNRGDSTSAVRLHLYDVDGNGRPGKDLINVNTTLHLTHKNRKLIKFDLLSYSIKLPLEGVFVGVEWIGLIEKNTGNVIPAMQGLETYIQLTNSNNSKLYIRNNNQTTEWETGDVRFKKPLDAAFGMEIIAD